MIRDIFHMVRDDKNLIQILRVLLLEECLYGIDDDCILFIGREKDEETALF